MKFKLSAAVFCFLCSTAYSFEVIDLGDLGGGRSFAYSINDQNQIVGQSATADGDVHVFMWQNGEMFDISAMSGVGEGSGNDINNRGQIAAVIGTDSVIFRGGTMFDIGAIGVYSKPLSINNYGQVAGYYAQPSGFHHAFAYMHGSVTPLGPFGPEGISIATGINDLGVIVGDATETFMVPHRVFLYSNGVMKYITDMESYAHNINNHGDIVGEYLLPSNTAFHAFIWSNGTLIDIGSDNSNDTVALDINDNGQAVGVTFVIPDNCSRDCAARGHAFLYSKGTFTDLNTLLPSNSEWELACAWSINAQGHIAGYGLRKGLFHAYMLSL